MYISFVSREVEIATNMGPFKRYINLILSIVGNDYLVKIEDVRYLKFIVD